MNEPRLGSLVIIVATLNRERKKKKIKKKKQTQYHTSRTCTPDQTDGLVGDLVGWGCEESRQPRVLWLGQVHCRFVKSCLPGLHVRP